jgi:hypothetical protein
MATVVQTAVTLWSTETVLACQRVKRIVRTSAHGNCNNATARCQKAALGSQENMGTFVVSKDLHNSGF